jgi:hypothetical protein
MSKNQMNHNAHLSQMIDKRHHYIAVKVADALKIDRSVVDAVLMMKENLLVMDKFFKANGPPRLLWFYHKQNNVVNTEDYEEDYDDAATVKSGYSSATLKTAGTNDKDDSMSTSSPRSTVDEHRPLLSVTTDPAKYPIQSGLCVYFLKEDKKATISTSNVEELLFGTISGSSGMLEELKRRLEYVVIPSLKSQTDWGELTPDITSQKSREVVDFLDSTDKFVSTVDEAITSLHDVVRLQPPKKTFNIQANTKSYQRSISKPDVVSTFEGKIL